MHRHWADRRVLGRAYEPHRAALQPFWDVFTGSVGKLSNQAEKEPQNGLF